MSHMSHVYNVPIPVEELPAPTRFIRQKPSLVHQAYRRWHNRLIGVMIQQEELESPLSEATLDHV